MALTKQQFNSLSAEDMWSAYSQMKVDKDAFDVLSSKLSEAVCKIEKFDEKIASLQSEVEICKTVNRTLSQSYSSLKRRLNQLEQYGRRYNIDISRVPENCADLQGKRLILLKKINVSVSSSDIVACYPIKRKGTIIVRFLNRKTAEMAIKQRRLLRNVDSRDIWGGINEKTYINYNLSPEYMKLRWYSKKMKAANLILNFGTDEKGLWIRSGEGAKKERIDIKEDLEAYVPNHVSLDNL